MLGRKKHFYLISLILLSHMLINVNVAIFPLQEVVKEFLSQYGIHKYEDVCTQAATMSEFLNQLSEEEKKGILKNCIAAQRAIINQMKGHIALAYQKILYEYEEFSPSITEFFKPREGHKDSTVNPTFDDCKYIQDNAEAFKKTLKHYIQEPSTNRISIILYTIYLELLSELDQLKKITTNSRDYISQDYIDKSHPEVIKYELVIEEIVQTSIGNIQKHITGIITDCISRRNITHHKNILIKY